MLISLNVVDSKLPGLLGFFTLKIARFVPHNFIYSSIKVCSSDWRKLNLFNANHSYGWHTTFALLIKVFLSLPNTIFAFLIFSPGPTGKESQWEIAWVLFRMKPLHLHSTKFEKENNKKIGHYCAYIYHVLFIFFLIKGIL